MQHEMSLSVLLMNGSADCVRSSTLRAVVLGGRPVIVLPNEVGIGDLTNAVSSRPGISLISTLHGCFRCPNFVVRPLLVRSCCSATQELVSCHWLGSGEAQWFRLLGYGDETPMLD